MELLPIDLFKECPDKLVFDLLNILRHLEKWLEMGNTSVPCSMIKNLRYLLDEKLKVINKIEED